ncbi:MFS transporter [Streptomyces sp. NPDC057099]|uniref:MFS transporter n=1 Tax=Streptomyces sp. NPDC057099 TaxID=3346019 RepID=UPI00362CC06E
MPERPGRTAGPYANHPPAHHTDRERRYGYRLFLGSHVLNETGAAATLVVLPLTAALSLGAEAWEMALLQTFYFMPYLVFGLLAGAIVERLRPRRVMIGTDLLRFAALMSLPASWAIDALFLPHLYAVALLLGCAQLFGDIADHSYLPQLMVKDRLFRSNSNLQMIRATAELGGPGLGGVCVQWLGTHLAVAANGLASALSALLLWRIPVPDAKPPEPSHGLARQTWQGIRILLRHPVLRLLALSASANNLILSATLSLDVVFLNSVVGVAPGLVGFLLAAGAVGALIGAWLAPRLTTALGAGRTAVLAVPVVAPFMFLIPLSGDGWRVTAFVLGQIAISTGITVFNIMQVTYRQQVCPPSLLSRMTAMFRFAVWGAAPLGATAGGALAASVGVCQALWILAGALVVVAPMLLCSPLRRMREFDEYPFMNDRTSC